MLFTALWRLCGLAVAVVLPAIAAIRLLDGRRSQDDNPVLLAIPLAMATVPPVALGLAFLFETLITPTLLVATSLIISALFWAARTRRPHVEPQQLDLKLPAAALLVLVIGLLVDIHPPLGEFSFEQNPWSRCTHVAVYDTTGTGSVTWLSRMRMEVYSPFFPHYTRSIHDGLPLPDQVLEREHGTSEWDDEVFVFPAMSSLPANYITNGYVNIGDQRLGNTAIYSALFPFLGSYTFHFAFALALLGTVLATAAASLRLSGAGWPVTLAAVLALLMPLATHFSHDFLYLVPDTLFAACLAAALISLALDRPSYRGWLLAGMLAGTLLSVRDVSLLCLPAFVLPLSRASRPRSATALFAIGALVTLFPTMYAQQYAYGSAWTSPAVAKFPGNGIEYSFLGARTTLPLFLNWPFHDTIVRTPLSPVPTFLYLPLIMALLFGTAGSALVLAGLWHSGERWVLLLWTVPLVLFLAVQEDWDVAKTSLIYLWLPALWIAVPEGVRAFSGRRGIGAIVLLTLVLSLTVRFAAQIEFDADPRWTEAYGLVLDRTFLGPHTKAIAAGRPLPLLPIKLPLSPSRLIGELGRVGDDRSIQDRSVLLPRFNLENGPVNLDLRTVPDQQLKFALGVMSGLSAPRSARVPGGHRITFPREGGGACTYVEVTVNVVGDGFVIDLVPLGPGDLGITCPELPQRDPLGEFFVWTDRSIELRTDSTWART